MKKLRFFKALFVAAALALMIPGCSDVNSDEGTNIPQTQGNKVALKISASEGYRTALPTVNLSSYTYELTADVMTENTPAGEPTALIPAGTSYTNLTKANSVYVEADKTYLFTLTATNGDSGDILSGTVTKQITTSDSTLSFQLFAIDSTSDTGSVSIEVTYDDGYGVASVIPTLCKTDGTSLAETYPLTYTAGDTAGTGTITGSVPVGASYVGIVLKDADATEIGSLPQEAVYAVKGLTSSSTVNVQVKKYKATIALTTSDSSAPTLTLKNPAITTEEYAGISTSGEGSPFTVTTAGENAPYTYTYTGYVPTAAYDVYKGATKIGTVQNVNALELNESVTLTSIAVTWKDGTAPTLYVGTTEAQLRAALTVTATLSSGTNTVTDYTISDFDSTATTEQTVTVSYTYNGVEKTAQIAVTLVANAPTITGIAVDTSSTHKTAFAVGNAFELTGLVIKRTYSDASTDTISYSTDNASEFGVAFFSDASCETSAGTGFTQFTVGTYYVQVTYAGFTLAYGVIVTDAYILTTDTATLNLTKTNINSCSYLAVTTDNWQQNKTYGDVTGDFYNMSTTDRTLTIKIVGVASFTVYVQNSTANRPYTVTIGKGTANSVTHGGAGVEGKSFDTNTTEETTIVLGGGGKSVYPVYIELSKSPLSTKKGLAVNGSLTAAYTIPSSATGNKGEETTITLSNVSVPTTAVTVSGDTSTTVAGAWAWDAPTTELTIATGDWSSGTATVTAKATFTPSDTSAYNTLAAQDVTITVTDERAEASPSTDTVTMGATSYIIDRAATTTASATSTKDNAITFESGNTNIFTVDASTGVMTPVHYGTATLTATSSENASATATVKVSRETPIESDTFDFRTGYMVSGTTASSFDYGVVSLTKASLNGSQHGIAIDNTGTLSIKVAGASAIYIGNEQYGGGGVFAAVKTSDSTTDLTSKLSATSYAPAASMISETYTELNDTTKAACQVLYYSGSDPATITLTVNAQAYFSVIFVEKYNPAYTSTFSLTAVGSSDITLAYSNGTLTASAVSGATVAETGYKWYIDNALQSDATSATLNVSALTSGIHSIVVEATDSSTDVTYAAQYVLTVN